MLLISGCEENITDKTSDLASYVEDNRIGEEQDVWLEQQSPLSNKWVKVVLIFGFTDDLSCYACQQLSLSTQHLGIS